MQSRKMIRDVGVKYSVDNIFVIYIITENIVKQICLMFCFIICGSLILLKNA